MNKSKNKKGHDVELVAIVIFLVCFVWQNQITAFISLLTMLVVWLIPIFFYTYAMTSTGMAFKEIVFRGVKKKPWKKLAYYLEGASLTLLLVLNQHTKTAWAYAITFIVRSIIVHYKFKHEN